MHLDKKIRNLEDSLDILNNKDAYNNIGMFNDKVDLGKDSNFESFNNTRKQSPGMSPDAQQRQLEGTINIEINRLSMPQVILTSPKESEGNSFRLMPKKVNQSPERRNPESPVRRIKYSPDKENF